MTLPVNTTYSITIRVRGINISETGMYPFIAFCDTFRDFDASDYATDTKFTKYVEEKVYADNQWTDMSFTFSTPLEYAINSELLFDKFFIGFYTGTQNVNYSYDIDTITLQKITNTNFYIDSDDDGTYELYGTSTGSPGTELTLPSATELKEVYNADGTGCIDTYNFNNWYSDEDCTQATIIIHGNLDLNLYCKPTVTSASGELESQIGFAGFDEYTEVAAGWSIDGTTTAITTEQAYSGASSLKLELPADKSVAAEIRNTDSLNIKNGQSYKVSFKYKTDAETTMTVATGKVGDVGSGKNLYGEASVTLTPADDRQTDSLLVDSNNPIDPERECVLALVGYAAQGATVYVDAVTVSAVTSSIAAEKTESGIRFMMSYDCGGDDVIAIEGEDYTVAEHGVLVTGADNTTQLSLENAGVGGIMKYPLRGGSVRYCYGLSIMDRRFVARLISRRYQKRHIIATQQKIRKLINIELNN